MRSAVRRPTPIRSIRADRSRTTDPATADYLSAALEDAALNRSPMLSPTVVSAYLKHRLGYGEKSEAVSSADAGEIRLIFDHDISEDGA